MTKPTVAAAAVVAVSAVAKPSKKNRGTLRSGGANKMVNCRVCQKLTHSSIDGNRGIELCKECYEDSGIENQHSDTAGEHDGDAFAKENCPGCGGTSLLQQRQMAEQPETAELFALLLVEAGMATKGEAPAVLPSKATRTIVPGTAVITVLAKENPRRGLAAKTFGIYKTGKTVAEWRVECAKKGADVGYLHSDIRAGYIAVK